MPSISASDFLLEDDISPPMVRSLMIGAVPRGAGSQPKRLACGQAHPRWRGPFAVVRWAMPFNACCSVSGMRKTKHCLACHEDMRRACHASLSAQPHRLCSCLPLSRDLFDQAIASHSQVRRISWGKKRPATSRGRWSPEVCREGIVDPRHWIVCAGASHASDLAARNSAAHSQLCVFLAASS